MAEDVSYIVRITMKNGETVEYDDVHSVDVADGLLNVLRKSEELSENRIRFVGHSFSLDEVSQFHRTYTCGLADLKAKEARSAEMREARNFASGIARVIHLHSTELDGDDAG